MTLRDIEVVTWGGGTQSTALLLMMLDGKIEDYRTGEIIKPHYIIFSDTGDESPMVYKQVYDVQKYVKEKYDFDIIITSKNKELLPIEQVEKMVKSGEIKSLRSSKYADLYQSHVLFYKGLVTTVDRIPSWTRNKVTGKVGKMGMKQCTISYKINQILKELRVQEGLKQFSQKKHRINIHIGFTYDEMRRIKPSNINYVENKFPLAMMEMTKDDCIDYVERELGFRPVSSVCNVCYANDFKRVYDIFKNDQEGWERLIVLDNAMNDKPDNHTIKDDVFMFKWQADLNIRLKDVDMEEMMAKELDKPTQISLFDKEQQNACMGGCFI